MEGLRKCCRVLMPVALMAAVLAVPAARAITPATRCDDSLAHAVRIAGEGKQPENQSTREKCKRAEGARTVPKGCPDGGERLPNDNNKRSPLDDAPPLTPLVA